MRTLLEKLIRNDILTKKQAKEALIHIAHGKCNPSQAAAFMMAYLMRSIRVEELEGFKEAMLELCHQVHFEGYETMDVCGTGGDGKDTFNISTTSAFVVAGAGQKVVKHGNNGVSSRCGSSNLLTQLGYTFTADETELKRSLETAGICFLHAPLFHPAMKNVAPIRRDLGIKTFFNMLGPQVNPALPDKQLIGVYSLELARLYQYIHQNEARPRTIVHALDGYDEVSLTGETKVITNDTETIYRPDDLGFAPVEAAAIKGGKTIKESAQICLNTLRNQGTKAQQDVVLANAGLALQLGKNLSDVKEGIAMARESMESGAAYRSLQAFLNPKKTALAPAQP